MQKLNNSFSIYCMDKNTQTKILSDSKLIESLGGVSTVANRLGYTVQRVYNWTVRGIPPYVKLEYPEIFQQEQTNSDKAA